MSYLNAVLQNMDQGKVSEIYKKEEETDNRTVQINVEVTKKNVSKFKKKNNFKNKSRKLSKELEEAREKLLNECLPSKELIEELSLVIGYTKKWQKTIPVNVEEDEIIIKSESDKEKIFSKKRFLLSRDFKNLLIKEYNKIFDNVYLTLFQSKKEENIFYIKISQRY